MTKMVVREKGILREEDLKLYAKKADLPVLPNFSKVSGAFAAVSLHDSLGVGRSIDDYVASGFYALSLEKTAGFAFVGRDAWLHVQQHPGPNGYSLQILQSCYNDVMYRRRRVKRVWQRWVKFGGVVV